MTNENTMDDHEKARIEEDARREVAERGKHGSAIRRYLQVDAHHALKKNDQEATPEPPGMPAIDVPRPAAGRGTSAAWLRRRVELGGRPTVMRVLVAVATRHGATREISEQIAVSLRREFEDAGVPAEVEVADAGRVASFATYDAAVLGSAVYIGHWLEQARRLVHEHRDELSRIPVWLFSSGPVGEPSRTGEDPVDVSDVVAASGAREHRLFGGKIDRSVLRFPERAVVAALRVKDGDNRDWPTIRAWGTAIARELSGRRDGGTGDLRPTGSGSPAASAEQSPRVL